MNLTQYKVEDRIGYITLNRPEKRNALNEEFVNELSATFEQAENDSACKVIVLKAEGKAFCAGADLAYLQQLQKNTREENENDSRNLMELFNRIYNGPKVVIAQIEGHALAGGCGLAALADFSFSVPEAKFGYTEARIGFVPAIVMVYLLRKVGEGKAREMLLSGEVFKADRAKELGLINWVCEASEIASKVQDFAQALAKNNSGQSMTLIKTMISRVQDLPLSSALEYAVKSNALARESDDCKKGISAFLNKEDISWE